MGGDDEKKRPLSPAEIQARADAIINQVLSAAAAEIPMPVARIIIGGIEIPSVGLRAHWRLEWCRPGDQWPERMIVSIPDRHHPIYEIGYSRPTLDIEVWRAGTSAAGEPIFWDSRTTGAAGTPIGEFVH